LLEKHSGNREEEFKLRREELAIRREEAMNARIVAEGQSAQMKAMMELMVKLLDSKK